VGNSIIHQDENYILSNDAALEEESEEYQRGYLNALFAQQKLLRNRAVPINPIQKKKETSARNGSAVPQKGKEIIDPAADQSSLSLDQIPAKNVLMDVVVADIPPRFGMLLSRS